MLVALLLTVAFGLVWGGLWGGLDAVFEIKGFLANGDQISGLFRNLIAMLLSLFVVSFIFGFGSNLISVIVALVFSIYVRPYVLNRWRW